MDPRQALDRTIKFFDLKAVDISNACGIDVHEISKYRHGHKDMVSVRVFKIVDALPLKAKLYFWQLCVIGEAAAFDDQKAS